jgi:hypothetical protein
VDGMSSAAAMTLLADLPARGTGQLGNQRRLSAVTSLRIPAATSAVSTSRARRSRMQA